jgi:phosphoglucosamine mutase
MVDELGEVINGDHLLAVCALHMKKKNQLKKDTLVVTQMSNYGLEKCMRENGIHVVKTNVGDKYVVEEMRKGGFNLGGEQSGHIIFLDHTTTGDGIIAALALLAVKQESGKKMSEMNQIFEDVPQVLLNCRVRNRKDLAEIKGYKELIADIEGRLKGQGRLLVRFSGTEPLIRVLVEGPDKVNITQYAEEIARLLEKELN